MRYCADDISVIIVNSVAAVYGAVSSVLHGDHEVDYKEGTNEFRKSMVTRFVAVAYSAYVEILYIGLWIIVKTVARETYTSHDAGSLYVVS